MSVIKRIISLYLLISVLGYGFAVASDFHNQVIDTGEHSHLISDDAEHDDEHSSFNDPDHCCHGVSHLLGLVGVLSDTINQPAILVPQVFTVRRYSVDLKPDFQPPISA